MKAAQAVLMFQQARTSSPAMRELVRMLLNRIELAGNRIRLILDKHRLVNWLVEDGQKDPTTASVSSSESDADADDRHIIEIPLSIRQRGVERRLVIEGQSHNLARPDQPLINMIARAHAYLQALTDGTGSGRKDVAQHFGVHPEDVSRLLPLAFLSPSIVEMILAGRQPADLSVRHLARSIELPISWAAQTKMLTV